MVRNMHQQTMHRCLTFFLCWHEQRLLQTTPSILTRHMTFFLEQLTYLVFNSPTIMSTLTRFPLPPRSLRNHSQILFVVYLALSTASEGRSTKPENTDLPSDSFVMDVPWGLLRCVSVRVVTQGRNSRRCQAAKKPKAGDNCMINYRADGSC